MRAFLLNYLCPEERFGLNNLQRLVGGTTDKKLYIDANEGNEPSNADFAALRNKVISGLAEGRGNDPFVYLKTHCARVVHHGFQTIPPKLTAKAICIVRNPLDIVASLAYHMDLTIDEAVNLMCEPRTCLGGSGTDSGLEVLATWSQHAQSWTYGDYPYPTFIVRYEDMLSNPYLSFGNVVSFLLKSIYEDQLHRSIEDTAFERLRNIEDQFGFSEYSDDERRKFFRLGISNNWEKALSEKNFHKIVEVHGEMMRTFGYLDHKFRPL